VGVGVGEGESMDGGVGEGVSVGRCGCEQIYKVNKAEWQPSFLRRNRCGSGPCAQGKELFGV
jgi:hypothetical protein